MGSRGSFLLVAYLAAARAFSGPAFTICSDLSADHAHVSAVSYAPDPVIPGKTLNVSFTVTPDINAGGGYIKLSLDPLGDIGTYGICTTSGLSCPLKPGATYSGMFSQSIPLAALLFAGETVSVRIEIRTEVAGVHEALAGCINVPVAIGSGYFHRNLDEEDTTASRALRRALTTGDHTPVPTLFHAVVSADPEWADLWGKWKSKHRKLYASPVEEARRFQAFRDNLYRLQSRNERVLLDAHSDMLPDEHRTIAHFA